MWIRNASVKKGGRLEVQYANGRTRSYAFKEDSPSMRHLVRKLLEREGEKKLDTQARFVLTQLRRRKAPALSKYTICTKRSRGAKSKKAKKSGNTGNAANASRASGASRHPVHPPLEALVVEVGVGDRVMSMDSEGRACMEKSEDAGGVRVVSRRCVSPASQ